MTIFSPASSRETVRQKINYKLKKKKTITIIRLIIAYQVELRLTNKYCDSNLTALQFESKKQDTKLLLITSPNVNDFQNSFTDRRRGKFVTKACSNVTLSRGIPGQPIRPAMAGADLGGD